jgi:exosortase/archaeosortase family protein
VTSRWRGALVVVLTVTAYHHSLLALLRDVGSDTPTAYLGLVPPLALAVALVKARPRPGEGRLPHPHADVLLGLPLLAVAAFVATVLPPRLSYDFWTNRIDLLGLPFFVAGTVTLLLGSRMLYRLRLPIAALVLAWPLPYGAVVDRVVALASDATVAAVTWAAPALGAARAGEGTVFLVGEGATRFTVNVAPECAGANGVLGFALVGGAVVSVAGGSRRARAGWLAFGAALQLGLNVVRIAVILATGSRWGEDVAIGRVHPYLGLVLFTTSVAVLVALLPRFGIPVRLPARPPRGSHRPPRRRLVAGSAACALALGVPNAALARFEPYAGVGDHAAYRAVGRAGPRIEGWTGRHIRTIGWAKAYFGASSTWERTMYARPAGHRRLVYVDAVSAGDLGAFRRYGLQACYKFHEYRVATSTTVDVGVPARAQALGFTDSSDRSWSVVSWVWPVGGGRFERIVVISRTDGSRADEREVRRELTAFSRSLVRAQRAAR